MTTKEDTTPKIIWIIIGASIMYILLKGGSSSIHSTGREQTRQQPTYNWEPLDKIPSIDDLKIRQPDSPVMGVEQQRSIVEKIERLEQTVNRIELQTSQIKLNHIVQSPINTPEKVETPAPIVKVEKVEIPAPIVKVEKVEIPAPIVKVEKVEIPAPIVKVEKVETSPIPSPEVEKVETSPIPSPEVEKVDTSTSIVQAQHTYKNNEKWKITRNKKGDIVSIEVVRNAEINGDKKQ